MYTSSCDLQHKTSWFHLKIYKYTWLLLAKFPPGFVSDVPQINLICICTNKTLSSEGSEWSYNEQQDGCSHCPLVTCNEMWTLINQSV